MSEVTRCSPNTWDNSAVQDCQRQMKIKTGSAGRLGASAGSGVAFWSSARHQGWGQESFLKLSCSGYTGCQAGFTLPVKRLTGGQEVPNDGGAVLWMPEPCHALQGAGEKRAFICISSIPTASSHFTEQTDETAFSGWITGRFGRICL